MDVKPSNAWPASFEERFADARGVRMRYFVGGAGPPLVLIHGLGGSADNWALLAPALARAHRVVIPDLPGHGGSSPLPVVANLDAFADRVALIAEREGALPAPVVAHSFGGVVALRLAARRPEAVTGAVLAAPAGISSGGRRARYGLGIIGFVQPAKLAARYRGLIARSPLLRRACFGYWGASDPAALSPQAVIAFLEGPALHTDTASAARALVRTDPREGLAVVRCRCLLLWGARDRQLGLGDGFEYARRLRAEIRVIPDCGHLLIGERPDACLDAIESFLERLA